MAPLWKRMPCFAPKVSNNFNFQHFNDVVIDFVLKTWYVILENLIHFVMPAIFISVLEQ